eukprot:gene29604-57214_t
MLLDHGVNPAQTDVDGRTPLHLAVCNEAFENTEGGRDVLRRLGDADAPGHGSKVADLRDKNERTALHR